MAGGHAAECKSNFFFIGYSKYYRFSDMQVDLYVNAVSSINSDLKLNELLKIVNVFEVASNSRCKFSFDGSWTALHSFGSFFG